MSYKNDLETLLDLDNVAIELAGGYWVKIEAYEVITTLVRPYGIRYSLTLHDKEGMRLMGFDNAHAVKFNRPMGEIRYDHYHRYPEDEGIPYHFISAYKLLKDFWREVDRTLAELGVGEVVI